ncbi:MAG TPA: EsaB/YukD family protein, partial [Nocardioides sp.]|nr:EsaB/YukD family protein [Nocardioides sp.]
MAAAVRVSVAADSRRVDVALPAAVPVAELLPELAAVLGVSGAATIATVTGRRLALEQGLAAQDVVDGAILVLATGRLPPPRVHDDVAEAMAEAVEEYVAPWPDDARRPAALVAGALLLATAAGAALHPLAAAAPVA